MKKARIWLDKKGVAYDFHDYRQPASSGTVSKGGQPRSAGEPLLNRAGTTFHKLPDKDKEGLTEKKAITLMIAQPSMIKRPCSKPEATSGRLQAEQYEKLL